MAEMKMLYRLIILYMLDSSPVPLSNTRITLFILDKEYTTFFTIQQAILDLQSSGLITAETTADDTFYTITAEGSETLAFFSDKISRQIKADIEVFLNSDKEQQKTEASAIADYIRLPDGNYEVRCEIRSGNRRMLNLEIRVPDREQAVAICRNWKQEYIETYTSLMDLLLN